MGIPWQDKSHVTFKVFVSSQVTLETAHLRHWFSHLILSVRQERWHYTHFLFSQSFLQVLISKSLLARKFCTSFNLIKVLWGLLGPQRTLTVHMFVIGCLHLPYGLSYKLRISRSEVIEAFWVWKDPTTPVTLEFLWHFNKVKLMNNPPQTACLAKGTGKNNSHRTRKSWLLKGSAFASFKFADNYDLKCDR